MAPGWYPDPTGRFEHRYHNGTTWTGDVANDGHRRVDTAGAGPAPAADPWPANPSARVGGPGDSGGPALGNPSATAALVLGIVGVTLGWLPYLAYLMIPVVGVGGLLALRARRLARISGVGSARATAGLVLAPIGLVVVIGGVVFTSWMTDAIRRYDRPASHAAAVTTCAVDGTRLVAEGTLTNDSARTASFTIRLEMIVGGIERRRLIELDDLTAGETATWRASARTEADGDTPTCTIVDVHGPLPLGVDPGR